MDKRILVIFFCIIATSVKLLSQTEQTYIKQMVWGADYQVYLKLDNDSSYNIAIDQLYHANEEDAFNRKTEFVYYPVNFEQSYIDSILSQTSSSNNDNFTIEIPRKLQIRKVTLWGSVGQVVGGGWAHFVNCLVYALETRQLELTAPLLKRPESNWKPSPITETYRRTHKWAYFVPYEQRFAKKEFRIRKKKDQLGDLNSVPQGYIDLMLNTSEKQYQQYFKEKRYNLLAKIDLVKLMLGTPYMSETQIDYIKSKVLQSISNYNAKRMPTVLIFEKYEAAVAMSLDGLGYKAEKIVFKDQENLSDEEIRQRTLIIKGLIVLINEANNKAFKERLNGLYKKL